jgi:hypothetical protein
MAVKEYEEALRRAEIAEAERNAALEVLRKVEAWMSSEDGPLDLLRESPPTVTWEAALRQVRDESIPIAAFSGGPWPEIELYREVLGALRSHIRRLTHSVE